MNQKIASSKYTSNELITACKQLIKDGGRIIMCYALHQEPNKQLEIIYLVDNKDKILETWHYTPENSEAPPSLANEIPLLGWHEREICDLFGIEFKNHPEPIPLVLHEGVKTNRPIFSADGKPLEFSYTPKPWTIPKVAEDNLQYLPFGPIRAAVVETAEYDFIYGGEEVIHLNQKLFFKHRGMELKFNGLTPEAGTILAERVTGINSLSHAFSFCQAVEHAASCTIPQYAKYARIILAELERLYTHIGNFGELCSTTTLKVAGAEGKLLEERFKQLNAEVTGSRFLRGMLIPGGLRRPINITGLNIKLIELQKEMTKFFKRIQSTKSYIDRLLNTGKVTPEMATDEGAVGPVDRATGHCCDMRRDHPYSLYHQLKFDIPTRTTGDANARAEVRILEIHESTQIILQALDKLPTSIDLVSECQIPPYASGLGWVEAPQGGLFYAVHFDHDGNFSRVKIGSPSLANFRVFPFTVNKTGIMDFAINEVSFALSLACCDR
jgi:formate hydrogenlyase subunit 5